MSLPNLNNSPFNSKPLPPTPSLNVELVLYLMLLVFAQKLVNYKLNLLTSGLNILLFLDSPIRSAPNILSKIMVVFTCMYIRKFVCFCEQHQKIKRL